MKSLHISLFIFSLFIFPSLLGLQHVSAQQTIDISTSNHPSWTVTDVNGAVVPLQVVGDCINPCVIQCVCDPNYPTPMTPNCGDGPVDAIWGAPPIQGGTLCSFAPDVFFFTQTIEIDDCEEVEHIDWRIIADNFFVLRINGVAVTAPNLLGNSTIGGQLSNWQREYNFTDNQVK